MVNVGFENTLCDLLTDRPAIERLADHIVDVNLKYVRQVALGFAGQMDTDGDGALTLEEARSSLSGRARRRSQQ